MIKRPLSTRMRSLQRLITQVMADMNWLLANCPKAEAKPCIELLGEINEQYCASLDALGERLGAQGGWDFEV